MRASPYAALLLVRRLEEQRAELALAAAHGRLRELEAGEGRARAGRHAWIDGAIAAEPAAGPVQEPVARLEAVERRLAGELVGARRALEDGRRVLLERRRRREAVERLHLDHLAGLARRAERRAQAELDEIATLRHGGKNV